MRWSPGIKSAQWEGGKFNVESSETLTAEIAEGIAFEAESFEAWQAG
jgi:hypothetical protein